ncbi:sugar ABC transporter permease [Acidisoma cellulosilytica]|uniref:Sugar ABC transporter permease n=1 Tax=Acidisoma cellulosilyticum TaxID=2802395 RepID=A0A963Z765_9PROT|nr:sugar ABC transporter permease [Acidisoma cellulosilyticum]MCB8883766.1 sugar ABC transporter permease [Acidisoma cellulosilyticum]
MMTPRRAALRRKVVDPRVWPWLLPLGLLLILFYLYPAMDVLRLSFTDASLTDPGYSYTFDSYASVISDPDFPGILLATVIFVGGSIIGQVFLGLCVALALNAGVRRRLPGVRLVQVAVLATWIIPGVSSGIIWQFMLNEASFGFFNAILAGLRLPPMAWLSNPDVAIWSATIANIWRGTALSMILLYAGLQAIPDNLYEAGALDGAKAFQVLRHITLPQLKPILLINIILVSIFSLNTFDLVLPLTGGGPGRATEVLSLDTYNTVFHNFDLGQGSVLAVLMLLIGLGVTMAYARLLRS